MSQDFSGEQEKHNLSAFSRGSMTATLRDHTDFLASDTSDEDMDTGDQGRHNERHLYLSKRNSLF